MNSVLAPQSSQLSPGRPIITQSSPPYVFNTDSKSATTDVDDAVEASTAGSATAVILHQVPANASYLELTHLYVGSDPSTQLKVLAFGYFPFTGSYPQERIAPADFDSNYPALTGVWLPLTDPLDPTTVSSDFDNTPAMESNAGTVYKVSKPKLVHLAGATQVLTTVSQAANNITRGMLLGRFRS